MLSTWRQLRLCQGWPSLQACWAKSQILYDLGMYVCLLTCCVPCPNIPALPDASFSARCFMLGTKGTGLNFCGLSDALNCLKSNWKIAQPCLGRSSDASAAQFPHQFLPCFSAAPACWAHLRVRCETRVNGALPCHAAQGCVDMPNILLAYML